MLTPYKALNKDRNVLIHMSAQDKIVLTVLETLVQSIIILGICTGQLKVLGKCHGQLLFHSLCVCEHIRIFSVIVYLTIMMLSNEVGGQEVHDLLNFNTLHKI